MAKKLIFQTEGMVDISTEDGGCAMIAENLPIDTENSDEDNGMFVKIQSWDERDEDEAHLDMKKLDGKRVRITIEVLD